MRRYSKRPWFSPLSSLLLMLPLLLGNSECNVFVGAAEKTSDSALMYAAQQKIDLLDYEGALTDIGQLSTTGRNSREGRVLEASARAGRCGLNYVNMANDLINNIGVKTIMEITLINMQAVTSSADCVTAETLLSGATFAELDVDEKVFLAFVSFAKIGAVLAANAKVDADNNGTVGAVNPCSAGDMSDAEIKDIGVAMNVAVNAISASGVSVAGSTTSTIGSLCTALGASSPCSITNPNDFTVNQVKAIRSLVNAKEIGLKTCNDVVSNCICP